MLHHIDVHVANLERAKALFDAFAEHVGYRPRGSDPDDEEHFAGYEPASGGRPRVGLIGDGDVAPGSMRLAFSAVSRDAVDAAAAAIAARGGRAIEGPSLHPEYGKNYYAVFFEDDDGNRYEIVAPTDHA
jgi:catechol 2,3-dioxygenase-like lactoylglutathione lyase family enzyme